MHRITRRTLLGLLCGGLHRALSGGTVSAVPSGGRSYRVDATVLLFSMPIVTRYGVGNGYARHSCRESDCARHEFEFAGSSLPERAQGLSRVGMIRETIDEASARVHEARYFGFMTASEEESLAQGKKALGNGSDRSTYVAIEGQSRPGLATSRCANFVAEASVANWPRLIEKAEIACKDAAQTARENRVPCDGTETLPTFLYALYRAIRSTEQRDSRMFAYWRDRYELYTEKKLDARTGQKLAERGLPVRPESVIRVAGATRNLRTGSRTQFRLWVEEGTVVPLRIEYQPRGYLQLAMEATG